MGPQLWKFAACLVITTFGYLFYTNVTRPMKVRSDAESHIAQAEVLKQTMPKRATRESLDVAINRLKTLLNNSNSKITDIVAADQSLVSLMTALKSNQTKPIKDGGQG